MRLIDADAFHDFISKHCDSSIEELWHELVRRQPTAYDVDKVVERLEKDGIRDAIEIVKSGGIE